MRTRKIALLLTLSMLVQMIAAPLYPAVEAFAATADEVSVESIQTSEDAEADAVSVDPVTDGTRSGDIEESVEASDTEKESADKENAEADKADVEEESAAESEETEVDATDSDVSDSDEFLDIEMPTGTAAEIVVLPRYYADIDGQGYGFSFAIKNPEGIDSGFNTDMTDWGKEFYIQVDDNSPQKFTVVDEYSDWGIVYFKPYVTYRAQFLDKKLSVGDHTVKVAVKYKDQFYVGTATTKFMTADSDSRTINYTEGGDPDPERYFSGKAKGEIVGGFYSFVNKSGDKAESVKLVKSGTEDAVATTTTMDSSSGKVSEKLNGHYSPGEFALGSVEDSILSRAPDQSVLNVYNIEFRLSNDIDEGWYDLIINTKKGNTVRVANMYYATKKPLLWSMGFRLPWYYGEIVNTKDCPYLAAYVYGLNLTNDYYPVYYKGSEDITEDAAFSEPLIYSEGYSYLLNLKDKDAAWTTDDLNIRLSSEPDGLIDTRSAEDKSKAVKVNRNEGEAGIPCMYADGNTFQYYYRTVDRFEVKELYSMKTLVSAKVTDKTKNICDLVPSNQRYKLNKDGKYRVLIYDKNDVIINKDYYNRFKTGTRPADTTVKVTEVRVNPTSGTLSPGETLQLTAEVFPAEADNKNVTWSTSNKDVASVDDTGKVTAKANGSAKITAKAVDGSGKYATAAITVKTGVESVTVSAASDRAAVGKTFTIVPQFNGGASDPTDKTLFWSVNDSSIASVSQKGIITGKSAGIVTVKAVSADGGIQSNELSVRIYEPVTGIKLDKTSFSLGEGESFVLGATVAPDDKADDGEHQGVKFSCADEIVTLTDNPDGSVTVKANALAGTDKKTVKVIATAKDGSGKSASCNVTIGKSGVESVTVTAPKNNDTHMLEKGKTLKLTAVVAPKEALNKGVTWESSAPAVASVDKNGTVKALSVGETVITATSVCNSAKKSTYVIKTYIPVKKITLTNTSVSLHSGQQFTLTASLSPENATFWNGDTVEAAADHITYTIKSGEKYLEKTGANTFKALNDLDGKDSQKAVIEVAVESDSGIKKTAICTVTVTKDAVNVSSVKTARSVSMGVGTVTDLSAQVLPASADNREIEWVIDEDSKDIISKTDKADGSVTIKALKAGKAKIAAVSKADEKKKAVCTVTVGNPVFSITISAASKRVIVGKTLKIRSLVKGDGGKAANTKLIWTSSNPAVAEVSDKGVVKAKAAGSATITATAETPAEGEPLYATIPVTAYVPVKKIAASRTKINVREGLGGSVRIKLLLPDDATDKTIEWTSSNEDVIKIANGIGGSLAKTATTGEGEPLGYKAIGAGSATITGRTTDGSKKTVRISVKVIGMMKAEDVKLLIKSVPAGVSVKDGTNGTAAVVITDMKVKKKVSLTPQLTKTAADKAVTFRTSNADVATVNAKGAVTAKAPGSATITMRTSDGGYEATCTITVTQ